jgi:hypothetical protein
MNTPLTVPPGIDRPPEDLVPTSAQTPLDEQSLVDLYMSLTEATESQARAVFMFIVREREDIIPIPST